MKKDFWSRQWWLWILIGGALLFFFTEQAYRYTNNPNYFPTLLLIGSFVVPLSFVAYIYQRERSLDTHRGTPMAPAVLTFLVGGAIGVVAAGLLEYTTLPQLSFLTVLGVGLIEETVKLIFPIGLFLYGRFRSETDGILFGIASGMGFASLETMGYGLVSFIQNSGDIGAVEQVLLVRGIISPAGHAAWTGLVCAVIWRQRLSKKAGLFTWSAFGAYLVAVLLHTLWNFSNSIPVGPGTFVLALIGNIAVAAISLLLLIRRMREARRYEADKP
jgi:protease PrsW